VKPFKVKKLKITSESTDRVMVRAMPKVKPLPSAKVTVSSTPRIKPKPVALRAAEKTEQLDKKEAARQRYRNEHNVVMTTCADNLAQLPGMAKMHTVTYPNGSVRSIPAFTVTAMGEPLSTTGVTVTRWVNKGMIPAPILPTSRGKVYGLEEARTIARILGEHQKDFKQYRDEHEDVKDKLFAEVRRIRDGIYQPTKR
jgi:hypothetical protein